MSKMIWTFKQCRLVGGGTLYKSHDHVVSYHFNAGMYNLLENNIILFYMYA